MRQNRLDIFASAARCDVTRPGTAPPGAVAPDWERLGGIFTSPPLLSRGAEPSDIFGLARRRCTRRGRHCLAALALTGAAGGIFTSPPAGGAWGQNRLDVFGLGGDGAMYHKAWDGTAWRPSPLDWERLGGIFTSPPGVVAWGQNRLDIFGLGGDGAMYHKAWDGTAWRPSPLDWERLGGVFTAP